MKNVNYFEMLILIIQNKFYRKTKTGGPTYEMRWATPDEFTEFRIMPRMLLDHLPDNILKTLSTVIEENKDTLTTIQTMQDV